MIKEKVKLLTKDVEVGRKNIRIKIYFSKKKNTNKEDDKSHLKWEFWQKNAFFKVILLNVSQLK